VQALNAAKGVQLKFWIDETNKIMARKDLTKTGTVEALRKKLADYYGLDLARTAEKPAGPVTRGHDMQQRQFAYLWELWDEWMECVASSRPFLLCGTSAGESFVLLADRRTDTVCRKHRITRHVPPRTCHHICSNPVQSCTAESTPHISSAACRHK